MNTEFADPVEEFRVAKKPRLKADDPPRDDRLYAAVAKVGEPVPELECLPDLDHL
jgi:hypothetical protein